MLSWPLNELVKITILWTSGPRSQRVLDTIFLWLYDRGFSFENNPKDLDLSYKTDLDLWDCLGSVKLVL